MRIEQIFFFFCLSHFLSLSVSLPVCVKLMVNGLIKFPTKLFSLIKYLRYSLRWEWICSLLPRKPSLILDILLVYVYGSVPEFDSWKMLPDCTTKLVLSKLIFFFFFFLLFIHFARRRLFYFCCTLEGLRRNFCYITQRVFQLAFCV